MKTLGLVLILVAQLAACAQISSDCALDEVQQAHDDLKLIAQRWDDAYAIANATGRGNLAGPVAQLQTVRAEAQAAEVPVCLEKAKGHLVDGMNSTITGFLDFMADKSDATINASFNAAKDQLELFAGELERVAACAPDCQ